MIDANWLEQEARHSLGRLLPRLEAEYAVTAGSEDWQAFKYRLEAHFPRLFQLLRSLYGQHHDFASYLEKALKVATASWLARCRVGVEPPGRISQVRFRHDVVALEHRARLVPGHLHGDA